MRVLESSRNHRFAFTHIFPKVSYDHKNNMYFISNLISLSIFFYSNTGWFISNRTVQNTDLSADADELDKDFCIEGKLWNHRIYRIALNRPSSHYS